MIRTKDEIIASVTSILGDAIDEAGLALLEDIADSMNVENEFKTKYEDLKARYIARFTDPGTPEPEPEKEPEPDEELTYDELFEEEDK